MRLVDIKSSEKKIREVLAWMEYSKDLDDPQIDQVNNIEASLKNLLQDFTNLRILQGKGSGRIISKIQEDFRRLLPEALPNDIQYVVKQETDLIISISSMFLGFNFDNAMGVQEDREELGRWMELFRRVDGRNSEITQSMVNRILENKPQGISIFIYEHLQYKKCFTIRISFPPIAASQNYIDSFWTTFSSEVATLCREVRGLRGL